MDDMNVFERRVADEMLRRAGPDPVVDDLAIFNAITATQSPKWRFPPMFSATKFVVAGALVALFGGFLLAGVSTQPSEQGVPGVAATPGPLSTQVVLPDVVGDVPDGTPDYADITEIRAWLDGDVLNVRFTLAGDVPAAPDAQVGSYSLYFDWDSDDLGGERLAYVMDIIPEADGWQAVLLRISDKWFTGLDVSVMGDSAMVTIPLSVLDHPCEPDYGGCPLIPAPPDWSVRGFATYLSGMDDVPDDADVWASLGAWEPVVPPSEPQTAVTPDLLPGVDLVTEEVEPGVYRVLSDGVREIRFGADCDGAPTIAETDGGTLLQPCDYPQYGQPWVVAGQDGSVWFRSGAEIGRRVHRLGAATDIVVTGLDDTTDFSVGPDGVAWAIVPDFGGELISLDDGVLTQHPSPEGFQPMRVEAAPDGSVWLTGSSGMGDFEDCDDEVGGRLALARFADGEWHRETVDPASVAGFGGSLAVEPDGTVLVGNVRHRYCPRAWSGIAEREEDGWVMPDAFGPLESVGPIAVGPDGTVWTYGELKAEYGPRLLRRTDGEWEILGGDESVPRLDFARMSVSADGRLWLAGGWGFPGLLVEHRRSGESIAATLEGACAGVLAYDGASWTQHLAGGCAESVSADSNGNVWATIVEPAPNWREFTAEQAPAWAAERDLDDLPTVPAGLYVITPEAVAEAE